MLRNVLKLHRSLQGAVSSIYKRYGTRALARVEMTDAASDGSVRTLDPVKTHEKYDRYMVYTSQTHHRLHYNLEELTEKLQKFFVEKLLEQMKVLVKENETIRISFNFVNENVFRCHLNMPIRKLGFKSFFKRYNDDRGLAVFSLKSGRDVPVDNSNTGSYNRMAYIKQYRQLMFLGLYMISNK
ncbi:uncharacterized protein LOC123536745 [Mercenaria mercenaria]|uniref:uncharacterized protein LOC123536745 n=1 Tax=Mercenaria mercenaria TaxID=6596 RepID=UPI00234F9D85|nr:uncharacterized protein LOC123536745 [Mercenaria mercenaria]